MPQNVTQLTRKVLDLDFPPMPRTLMEILEIRSETKPDMTRLLEVTQSDPAITAGVLRRVNSAHYGLRRNVEKLDRAITLLGFNDVCSLAYTAAVKKAFAFPANGRAAQVYDYIMRHSIASALVARNLAAAGHLRFTEKAFTAGLLHQLGRVVLLYSAPDQYAPLWLVEGGQGGASEQVVAPSLVAEHRLFSTSYLQVGSLLAERWHLGDDVRMAMQYHQHYNKVHNPYQLSLTLLVTAGGMIASRLLDSREAPREQVVLREIADRCKVEVEDLVADVDEKEEEVLRLTNVMC